MDWLSPVRIATLVTILIENASKPEKSLKSGACSGYRDSMIGMVVEMITYADQNKNSTPFGSGNTQ